MNSIFRRFTAAALLLTAASLPLASTVRADEHSMEAERRILTVTGEDTVRIPATLAQISIIIEAREKTSAEANRAVVDPSRAVLDFLESEGAERIQAGALTLNPIYSRMKASSMADEGPQITGYQAQWNASFVVPAERAGEFASGVVEAGANRVTQFAFLAADDAIAAARTEALQSATREARATAEAVLATLDYELAEVVRIHVNTTGPVRPLQRGVMHSMAMESSAGSSAAVEPGFIDINGNVTLEVRY
ncbi:SIMPL domain-containing protein [Actomonas aquatica]|uniref:SIMPL domain-containing protein n=1 Tax=Actomonas aquatica TaxID=2866162 RepID=A0ABZ1C2N9_9BACT|nr:SIMPL domain-containing protein [Opitutus sp. WL0086]WRQ85855.1 SIMPL domain-containing protein [Opitutus sp. WL0086]